MKFGINKVSTRWNGEKPVSDAIHAGQKRNGMGYNTDPPTPVFRDLWEIEINTLDDLMNLIKEHGQIIMYEHGIEIYDGYAD